MSAYHDILVEHKQPHVTRISLNRPDHLNAYTSRMAEELADAVATFGRDDASRVLIITGAGRGFCSGGDVRSDAEIEIADRRMLGHAVVMREGFHHLARTFRQVDKPIIAEINGPAVAGGLVLALLCDIRVAGEEARFGDPSGTAGLLPDEGGAWLFPRTMGLEPALRMTLLGEIFDARRALELGLVGEVVPQGELSRRVADLAARLAARAPLAVRLAKRMMVRSQESTLEQSLLDAELAVMITNDSSDVAEGIRAFTERRIPEFEGR